jgi:FAD:protein FMN transferase
VLSMILKNKPKHSWRFEAIGTHWVIESVQPFDDLKVSIAKQIEEFDRTYSRFREDSLVSKIAEKPGEYDFPTAAQKLIGFYHGLYTATDGAMSPLVGKTLVEAGYDKNYSLKPGTVHKVPAWNEVMQWHGSKIMTTKPVTLDFGAAGKGYLVDRIGELLEQSGHHDYVIDASGDMRVRGDAQTVGLENPNDRERVIGTMKLQDGSLCASATNRRAWGNWHHVIDARTAKPTADVVATWVVASETYVADGLATALFFVPAQKLATWKFDYVRLHANGSIEHSPTFVGELFL